MTVSLEQYAFVTAAVADKIELLEVLEHLEIAPRAWEQASQMWMERLMGDLSDGGALSIELDHHQVRAREHWARPIPPLDEDLGAWIDFQRGLGRHEDPIAYFASVGLSPGELGRLARLWGERLGQDEDLRKSLQEIMKRAPREITVAPLAPPTLTPHDDSGSVDGTGFYTPIADEDLGLPFDAPSKDEARGVHQFGAPPLDAPLPKPPAGESTDLDGTAMVGALFDNNTLPFGAGVDAIEPRAPEPQAPKPPAAAAVPPFVAAPPVAAPPVVAPPPSGALDETASSVRGADVALPFTAGDAVPPPLSPEQSEAVGETGFLDAASLGLDALPFDDPLEKTGSMDDVTGPTDLPFQGRAPAPPLAELEEHEAIGETGFATVADLGLDMLPFQSDKPSATADALLSHQLLPHLPHTLAQYAAVSIELQASPQLRGQVLARFKLDESALTQLATALHALLSRDARAKQAWDSARQTYFAWRQKPGG